MKLGDLDVDRIGLGTNRVARTRDNVAFIKAAVATREGRRVSCQ
jgi:hypothetical protein